MDCLDATDNIHVDKLDRCYKTDDIDCEEYNCGSDRLSFSCGDCMCTKHAENFKCKSKRDLFNIKNMFKSIAHNMTIYVYVICIV